MALQWFPGHMHKALKEIKESLSQVDILIEVLDARIPFSSENPEIAKIRGDKPCIRSYICLRVMGISMLNLVLALLST